MIDLSGQVALVTGGSRGIGRAICILLASAGANLIVGYQRSQRKAAEVQKRIGKLGRRAILVQGDIALRETHQRLFDEGRSAFGQIDIAVGNAGVWKRAPIDEMSQGQWEETLNTNLTSAFWTCQYAVREMKPRASGSIILVSSTAGQRGEANYSHYAATKGALLSLTKSLAAELGPSGIRVNAVAPGWVDTDMVEEVFADPDFRQQVLRQIPLGRIATAEDIAGAVLFLASDLARHVQGEVLNVNGGSVLCG
jgi:3-oxoacyl-[acyl-carrier protein] reductase